MNDDIKVGDICFVVGNGYHFCHGAEVEIMRGPWTHPIANEDESFLCRSDEGHQAWCYRANLRKKPPVKDGAASAESATARETEPA